MTIDPTRLQRDAKRLKKSRQHRKGPGTMAAVRAALPTIYRLRADGVLWKEIAAALGKQGVIEGKGKKRIPVTETRLTALVTQIERLEEKKAVRASRRPKMSASSDLTDEMPAVVKPRNSYRTPIPGDHSGEHENMLSRLTKHSTARRAAKLDEE